MAPSADPSTNAVNVPASPLYVNSDNVFELVTDPALEFVILVTLVPAVKLPAPKLLVKPAVSLGELPELLYYVQSALM